MSDEIPSTEQGLNDYIRFSISEIKRCELKIKRLNEAITECNIRLGKIKNGGEK